ncbi:MAG: hypothetical protein AMJ73_06895 [candidate division Zixibacteria bacterium SM1_73]|nr:MAG: hypothetical protein AMJ73_06895 [candidate division Zixibacteria bacterium SM1_73]
MGFGVSRFLRQAHFVPSALGARQDGEQSRTVSGIGKSWKDERLVIGSPKGEHSRAAFTEGNRNC